MILAAQKQGLGTNFKKFSIDQASSVPWCRLCGTRIETIRHQLVNVHNWLRRNTGTDMTKYKVIRAYWEISKKYGILASSKWHEHQPLPITKNELTWYMTIYTDKKLKHNKPNLTLLLKREKYSIFLDIQARN